MEQINLGSLPDGAGGDSVRVAFTKCNDNFTQIANKLGAGGGGGGGVDHTQELAQIKQDAAALAERVRKLEQAAQNPGPGGPDHTQELKQLKQQLQGLQQTIGSLEQTVEGARQTAATAQATAGRAEGTANAAQQAAQEAKQKAQEAQAAAQGVPVGAVVAFPRAVANPEGFLKCDGSAFSQAAYPDLYRALSNSTRLPDLTRSDVGMTAYFPVDSIPSGWIKYDDIATRVKQSSFPELYRLLTAQYGTVSAVPKARDRFLRNAAGGLSVGTLQDAEIARHYHPTGLLWSDNDDWTAPRATEYGNKTSLRSGDPVAMVLGQNAGGANQINGRLEANLANNVGGGNNWTLTTHTDYLLTEQGGGETRPKSLVMVLCIKAKNSLDDAVFWIKAFGSVTNAGTLDASALAAGLQGKADKGHTHRASDITDFNDAVKRQMSSVMQHQSAANGYSKLPNGLIDQWGFVPSGWQGEGPVRVQFPVAFPFECLNVQITVKSGGRTGAVNTDITIGAGDVTTVGFNAFVNTWGHGASAVDFQGFFWRALGK